MKLEIINFDEATGAVELDVDEEGKQYLLELGFNSLLMKALESLENEREPNEGV